MAGLLRRSRDSSTEDSRNQALRDQQILDDQIAEVQSMQGNDSLKAILGKILINQNILNRKNKVDIDHDIGDHYYNFKEPQPGYSPEQIQSTVKEGIKTFEDGQLAKKLNFSTQNNGFEIPTFNPVPREPKDKAMIHKYVLQGKSKFSGEKGQSIIELLTHCNSVQKMLNMCEEEFKSFLLQNTTKEVFNTCRNEFLAGSDVKTIYDLLQVIYSNEMTPEDAKKKLFQYKATKKDNLYTAFATVRKLCSASIDVFLHPEERNRYLEQESTRQFIRCLPDQSQTMVELKLSDWRATFGTVPKTQQFFKTLAPLRVAIDKDIAANGAAVNPPMRKFHSYQIDKETTTFPDTEDLDWYEQLENDYENSDYYSDDQESGEQKHLFSINRGGANSRGRKSFRGTGTKQRQGYNSNRKPNNPGTYNQTKNNIFKESGSKYCSLCGMSSHNASDRCFRMRDDKNKIIDVVPVQRECSVCQQKLKKNLFHPERYCFLRPELRKYRQTRTASP